MIQYFIKFEWKQFFRSSYWQKSIALNILMGFLALYFMLTFLVLGISIYPLLKKQFPESDPLIMVNGFLFYWFLGDLVMRFFLQKLPVMNIKPLLALPIKRSKILNYVLGKSAISFFNFLPLFAIIPFGVILIFEDYRKTNPTDLIEAPKIGRKLPDTLSVQKEEIDPAELDAINTLLEETLAAMDQSRIDEGALLSEEFSLRIANIHQLLQQVIDMDAARMGGIKPRLEKALSDITAPIDQNRLEQELIYYIEKYDITEEKVRLAGHLDYFSETQSSSESQGKKLGFIAQEIGREINTLGSKANFAPMQQLVVQMKDELEKIKEQLLNAL